MAYFIEPLIKPDAGHWPFLAGIKHVRSAFAVGWWHNGAYLGALVATVMAGYRVQKQRRHGEDHSDVSGTGASQPRGV